MSGTHISAAMRQAVGREYGAMTSYPITVSDIRRWAAAVYWPETPPRLYWDEEYAQGTRHHGIVAPEEYNPFAWLTPDTGGAPRQASPHHDTDDIERRLGVKGPGLGHMLNGGADVEYGERMRPGDVIRSVTELTGYRERPGRLGLMLFTVFTTIWTNQREQLVKSQAGTLIRY